MPVVTWDHVHLRSPNPEATAIWLEDILGGEIIRGPGRIDVKLGDEMNGYDAETCLATVAEIIPWLQEQIHKHYPTSKYNLDRLKGLPDKVVEIPQH